MYSRGALLGLLRFLEEVPYTTERLDLEIQITAMLTALNERGPSRRPTPRT